MATKSKVSVLVPTFNRAALLPAALDSLLGQSRRPDEIIVVDDGCTDGTLQVLDRYAGRVQVIGQANTGKSGALNRGLAAASGSVVWFFDDDDVALPDTLERHLRALEEQPEAGFTLSPGWMCDPDPATGRLVPWPVQPIAVPFDTASFLAFVIVAFPYPFHLQGGLIRRECVEGAGGFDAEILRSQDYGFVFQLALRYRVLRLDAPSYLHRQGNHARGTRSLAHAAIERTTHWTHFGRLLWRKWQGQLELMDHLPRDPLGRRLQATPETLRDARVARCAALYAKGLWDDLLAELDLAFANWPPGTTCGRFAAELWMNTVVRLRINLWPDLDRTAHWEALSRQLRGPAAGYLGGLMAKALAHRRTQVLRPNDHATFAQLDRMIADLQPRRS